MIKLKPAISPIEMVTEAEIANGIRAAIAKKKTQRNARYGEEMEAATQALRGGCFLEAAAGFMDAAHNYAVTRVTRTNADRQRSYRARLKTRKAAIS